MQGNAKLKTKKSEIHQKFMSKKNTAQKLQEILTEEAEKFASSESKLSKSFKKFSAMGIITKSTYTLPLKDTIGKTFREQTQHHPL